MAHEFACRVLATSDCRNPTPTAGRAN
jgi:hypothetical protein